jgi:hypothetical protein
MDNKFKELILDLDNRFKKLEEKHQKDFEILDAYKYDIYSLTSKCKII